MTSLLTDTICNNDNAVCASAPGKVILFGEHAVVYGEPALAAALSDLRIAVRVKPTFDDQMIRIQMPDLSHPIDFEIPMERVMSDLKDKLKIPPTPACAEAIEEILVGPSHSTTSDNHHLHQIDPVTLSALTPLIYLIHQILSGDAKHPSGLQIQVRSQDLPVGAGLGSSAAFSVASTAALMQLRLQQHNEQVEPLIIITKPDDDLLEEINRYAYYSEMLLHGTPSGIDNAVSTFGGAILFTKQQTTTSKADGDALARIDCDGATTGKESSSAATTKSAHSVATVEQSQFTSNSANVHMERYTAHQMPALASMPLLLVDTHVSRSTKRLVAGVRAFYEQHPQVVSYILRAMGQIAKDAAAHLLNITQNTHDDSHSLLTLMETNHRLLQAINVSHASLDRICEIVSRVAPGRAAAKLTGAGGGGCAIVLFDTNASAAEQKSVRLLLEGAAVKPWKFTCFSSKLGGDGVLFVPPSQFPSQRAEGGGRRSARQQILAAIATLGSITVLYAVAVRHGRLK